MGLGFQNGALMVIQGDSLTSDTGRVQGSGLSGITTDHYVGAMSVGCASPFSCSFHLTPPTSHTKKKVPGDPHTVGCHCSHSKAVYLSTFFQLLPSDLKRNNVSPLFLFTLFHLSAKAQNPCLIILNSVANNALLLPWWLSGKESACQCRRLRFLGRENPLEKEMATHSSILIWEIP